VNLRAASLIFSMKRAGSSCPAALAAWMFCCSKSKRPWSISLLPAPHHNEHPGVQKPPHARSLLSGYSAALVGKGELFTSR